ncbi:hypothetical protein GcM3_128005 [Golovinomyces cichoracearum]|uniref:F-box domain-containing protein n=1 Tax=Golovinomyces cichoracearum TaxID=62708 RepID=A0A420I5F7_9PEZI|nr:hypothetical protein GcM3_128005 [Golovinomyces cichoracearum]
MLQLVDRKKKVIRDLFHTLRYKLFKSRSSFPSHDWLPVEFQRYLQEQEDELRSRPVRPFSNCGRDGAGSAEITILSLAPELILQIASKLSLSYAVALCLSSRYFYFVLKERYIPQINTRASSLQVLLYQARTQRKISLNTISRERQKLLSLLDRDNTRLIFCYFCQKLHKPLPTPSRTDRTASAYPCTYAKYGTKSCNVIFNTSQVRMAMKLYHQGIDPSKNLQVLAQSTRSSSCYTSTRRIVPRIVGNRLYMKVIHEYTVPFDSAKMTWYDGPPLPPSKIPNWTAVSQLSRCPESGILLEVQKMVRTARDKPKTLLKPSSLSQCPKCKVEYEVRVPKIATHYAIVECISWHDLGEGDLPFWSSMLMSEVESITGKCSSSKLGSIRCTFEIY